uniref:Poly [ADP-ribose] polymerase n=1 Tax=Reticulitermes speratus TaxID=60591 RepID=A0A2Z5U1X2_9NEOP
MSDDLPYRAEYAKSGRASCKGCKNPIAKDTLRLAVMVQSPMFDGKTPHWYHFMCFFGRQRPKTVGDISHFESLRWEDQEKIKAKIEGGGGGGGGNNVGSSKGKGKKRTAATAHSGLKDFTIEYAKSSRSTCRGCEEKIMKDEVRISKKDFESENAKMYGGQERWHHVECFAKLRDELEFWESGDCLPGIKSLKKEDQQLVKERLPKVERKEKPADEADGPTPPKKMKSDKEDKIKEQNKLMYKYRDQLKKVLKKKDLQYLLEYNDQDIPSGEDRMLDRLSDIMTFGALGRCDECKAGQFVFRSGVGYQCEGDLTEWTKCQNTTLKPKRKPFRVPLELSSDHEFLEKYKYVARKRAVELHAPSAATHSDSSSSVPKVQRTGPPLKNMEFVILGKTTRPKDELKKEIKKLGGKVVTNIHDRLAAVISTPDELQKMNTKMEEVKACDVQVLPDDFLDEVQSGDVMALITKKNISSWGSDPHKRMSVDTVDSSKKSKSKSMFTKSVPSKVKLQLKGGAAVDPDSDLADIAHVYRKKHDIYNAVLGMTDIQSGKNSYYKLQVLESDAGNRYWIFRSWGRIGTTIGGKKLEEKDSLPEALRHFGSLYEEKTGNMWSNRKHFQKVPGRFFPVDLDYTQEDDDALLDAANSSISCKLALPVQELIKLIFDVNLMKRVMLEFELDLQKMPLGKLSKKQIQQAYSVLSDLQELIKSGGPDSRFLDASNRFYTLVPHNFGIEIPPVLNSEEMIKQKLEMLESLMEIEIAYSMLKTKSDAEGDVHPLDAHYAKLNTHIEVLDKQTDEFELLEQYVKNTHAATHTQYDLEILEVFKVKRNGEEKRYKPFRKLHNRKLLWHGSRLTNFAGILSQGLRIAPPEAPVTGYMFGKGIYFADMVSKSANYCSTSPDNSVGLMLLCEVALGNMHECKAADYIEKLPKNKHSTKGLGRTEPDPKTSVKRKDGVEVPIGKGVSTGRNDVTLLYNEYIVYDVAQVNVQYLLKMKFSYKY